MQPASFQADAAPPRLYGELASWWPLLSPPSDYAAEAAAFVQILRSLVSGSRTLLELGSGGGNTASHLRAAFQLTLADLFPAMLDVSRALNPECEHVEGDMRQLRLGRCFDCVLVHDAIMYMTTPADLGQAIATAFAHCRPGGAALFVPDFTRESFSLHTDHGGIDDPAGTGRGLRYLEWVWDPDPDDTACTAEFAFLLRDPDGSVHVERDRHLWGLFSRQAWLDLIAAAGFEAALGPASTFGGGELFIGKKPAAG